MGNYVIPRLILGIEMDEDEGDWETCYEVNGRR